MQTMSPKRRKRKRGELISHKHPDSLWPKRLRDLRDKYDLSQVEAAKRAGVSAATWITWENCQREPGRMALNLLRAAFPNDIP